ncbi:MAG: hypothetical protein PV362_14810 [Providencia heimbachae]|nr:hypothetical protein [Providencia heimbachae]
MIDKLFGLKIRNLDGSEFIFNEHTAPATNLWTRYVKRSDGLSPDGDWLSFKWTCPYEIPEGYGFQVVSQNAAEVTFIQSGDRRYVSGTKDKIAYSANDRKITVNGMGNYDLNYVKIIAFPTIESQKNASRFGLKIKGSSIFLENTPPLGYAYAAHKAKVFIDKAFDVGKTFPGLTIENAVFFFYTDDNKSFIRLEPSNVTSWDEVRWWRYVSRNKDSTDITAYTSAWYWVIAFTNMKPEQLDTPGFGLKIRNFTGAVTFNSSFGVMTRPITLPGNQIPVGSDINIESIRRPMYTPTRVGEVFSSNGGLGWWRDLNICNLGESQIGLYQTSTSQQRGYHGNYTVARTAIPAIFLDAADYFPFP